MELALAARETDNPVSRYTPHTDPLPWIHVAPGAPYFITEQGDPWTPIGQNDAITWPELAGLFRRRDIATAEKYLGLLSDSGVTCLRLMLEYCHFEHRYIERPVGRFVPSMVQLWDDLFALCERYGLRILLTPYDTFWMWRRWSKHPYNRRKGGPCSHPSRLLLCPDTRAAIKGRLSFMVERWGGSGALFAWDLWNEIHPGHAEESAEPFHEFIADLSAHVRELEQRLYGRTHPQTVSIFGPEIIWRPHMDLTSPILRHPALDFANIHIYQEGTIDFPRNTVDPARDMGRIVRGSLAQIEDDRPFFDSEHGPIHSFKDHYITLPAAFDDEYFRHMQWAHFASGAAGGGMRWPNRTPHSLTPGMREAQRGLADFLPLIDWPRFRRRNVNEELRISPEGDWARFGCADESQVVVWLLRADQIGADGCVRRDASEIAPRVEIPGLAPGRYRVTAWDTRQGTVRGESEVEHDGIGPFVTTLAPTRTDIAAAVVRVR